MHPFTRSDRTSSGFAPQVLALALGISFAPALAGAQASAPRLRHVTAPFVGQTLRLEVDGAAPAAALRLYFAPEAGSTTTPYGVLELRRQTLVLLARGTTTASGTWSFETRIPLAKPLAETGAHFQALVDDPTDPAGLVLSDAVHARFLGPRVYAGYGGARSAGFRIVSAATETVVASFDCPVSGASYGFPREGKPVFDAVFSRGAAMITDRELAIFDPYFGQTLARIPFAAPCARTVFTDADQNTVHVLELAGPAAPARVHAIDLRTGAETGVLALPGAVEPIWCVGRASSEVFVAEHEPGGRTAVRRIDLVPLVDRGSTPVGTAQSDGFLGFDGTQVVPLPMLFAGEQLVVSTRGSAGASIEGSLTRCFPTRAGLATHTTALGTNLVHHLGAVPAAARWIGCIGATGFGPYFRPCEVPIPTLGPPTLFAAPGNSTEFYVRDVVADGGSAWVVAETAWQGSDHLFRLDVATHAWTTYPHAWFFGPSDAEPLVDAWDHALWIANVGVGPPVNLAPEILVVDELLGSSRHIVLDRTASVLHAVPLP